MEVEDLEEEEEAVEATRRRGYGGGGGGGGFGGSGGSSSSSFSLGGGGGGGYGGGGAVHGGGGGHGGVGGSSSSSFSLGGGECRKPPDLDITVEQQLLRDSYTNFVRAKITNILDGVANGTLKPYGKECDQYLVTNGCFAFDTNYLHIPKGLSGTEYGSRPGRSQRLKANRIDGFDNRALRAFEGIKWFHHVTKETFRAGTKQAPASSLAVMHRIRWLGHVLRLLPEHPTRTELNFDPRETERRRPEDPPAPAASTSLKKTLGQAPCMGQAWMEKSGLPVWLYTLTSTDQRSFASLLRDIVHSFLKL
nr:forkhead box protein D1-like [Penaeus vannamei]